ncbi:bile acid:sodium symporter family protein [Arthrospiribacter ruber]|uniref:Bile acid:sodium symporter family protein n=1 Tax=Arthrospiribacter ruber TaxID=2487934 RepID=A0A951J0V7_9BACT|nr:bile acid:sodium symporter family protein [Arthrospiribacter ruber]MBW3469507.1 bile acid:sodium symporter family protein [Arthrospiribacter ruber]
MKSNFYLWTGISAALFVLLAILTWILIDFPTSGYFWILALIAMSIAIRKNKELQGYTYTVLIFASVLAALFYPNYFVELNGYQLSGLIVPLLQIIMFGMGTSMSLNDFKGVFQMPKGVIIGLLCQFTIMPFIGYGLAKLSGFPPEIAAGLILIGCSPSGMASNVMSYLAKANLALSITITSVTTFLAPFVTPALMGLLAGEFVAVEAWKMMMDIIKIVMIPIGFGLLFNRFFKGKAKWLDEAMPVVSMLGIALILIIIIAAGRDSLLTIGPLLIALVVIHNLSGYTLGYWAARLFRMPEQDCRTIALEVGMQNGGLASGIAKEMGKIATVGLAPAVFGPLMNITGSVLASFWHRKPVETDLQKPNKETVKP